MSKPKDEALAQLEGRVAGALKAWHAPNGSTDDLLHDLLIAQTNPQDAPPSGGSAAQRLTTNRVLLAGIEALAGQDAELAQVLRLRFIDRQKLWAVANKLAISEQTVSRFQKKGIRQLAHIIHGRESAQRDQAALQMEATLPPATYTRLFGVEETIEQLLLLLQDRQGPNVIAIVGMGGLGKTAVADTAVRQIIRRFLYHNVIWLRVEHQTLSGQSHHPELTLETLLSHLAAQLWPDQAEELSPQQRLVKLRQTLNIRPHLIVIDNLESQTDADYVLNQLHSFTQSSKFLLTSRSQLTEQASVFNIRLPEIGAAEAIAFIRYHAQECGITSVADASDHNLGHIYQLTGGNPLALKLVVSLLDIFTLPDILDDLTATHTLSIAELYHYIFWQTWYALSTNGRVLLQAMPLVSESGGTPAYLATVSGLSKEQLWPALRELWQRSLIEVRGTIHEKRYGIHRLTNSFMCTEIIHMLDWQSPTDDE